MRDIEILDLRIPLNVSSMVAENRKGKTNWMIVL